MNAASRIIENLKQEFGNLEKPITMTLTFNSGVVLEKVDLVNHEAGTGRLRIKRRKHPTGPEGFRTWFAVTADISLVEVHE